MSDNEDVFNRPSKRLKTEHYDSHYDNYDQIEKFMLRENVIGVNRKITRACYNYLTMKSGYMRPPMCTIHSDMFGEYAINLINSSGFDLNVQRGFFAIKPHQLMKSYRDDIFIKMIEGNTKQVSNETWDIFYIAACSHGSYRIVKYLLDRQLIKNADVNVKYELGFYKGVEFDLFSLPNMDKWYFLGIS